MKKLQKEKGRRGKWMALEKAASTEEMDPKFKLTILNIKKSSYTIPLTEVMLHCT